VKKEEGVVRAANGVVSTPVVVATTPKDTSMLARVRAFVQEYLQQSVAVVLQQHQQQQQLPNDNNNHWRQKVAFCLLTTLMAWRHHRLFAKIATSIAAAILAPITELIEALVVVGPSHPRTVIDTR
jgi:hypothetical protein